MENFFALPIHTQLRRQPFVAIYFAFHHGWCRISEGEELFADHRGWGRWRWLYLWLLLPLGWLAGIRGRAHHYIRECKADLFGRR